MRTNLNNECKELERIIKNLINGKETCRIENEQFTLSDVIDFLQEFLQELKELNEQIVITGNTTELLKQVHDKYDELWLFQVFYYVDSLPVVIGGLLYYPNDVE